MRLVRLGALFGSLLLLVATSVSLMNKRSELSNAKDFRVASAAVSATNAVETTLVRARAVVTIATGESDLKDLLETFDPAAAACIIAEGDARCSGSNLAALDSFGDAAAASVAKNGGAVAFVDVPSSSVLVVARGDATIIIQLPDVAVVGPRATALIERFRTDFEVKITETGPPDDVIGISTVGGLREVESFVVDPLDRGTIEVRSSVDGKIGLAAGSPGLYSALLGLGTVLLALAGWTFLVERRQLERRATTDELTGLVNRREFERRSEEAIVQADRFGTGMCVMLIDLNGFKQINDTLGHQFGDVVLKECAVRLVDAVRDTDLVGRWGGDEFVVLLPGLEEASAVRASADRIWHRMADTPVAGTSTVTSSIGSALYSRHGVDLHALMDAADVAMYEAKTTGVAHRIAEAMPNADDVDRTRSSDYDGPDRRRHPSAGGSSEPNEEREGVARR